MIQDLFYPLRLFQFNEAKIYLDPLKHVEVRAIYLLNLKNPIFKKMTLYKKFNRTKLIK